MMLRNHVIYIIGFMGSGKTTAGKKLASILEWSFIDLDKKIEEETGMTIPDIFSKHGEEYFRSIESQLLKSFVYEENTVVSTGGGTPCYGDNMEFMLESGITIYLEMTPLQLRSRISGTGGERPLIKNLDREQLLAFIDEKLREREKWYKRAEIKVSGMNLNINNLGSSVRKKLSL